MAVSTVWTSQPFEKRLGKMPKCGFIVLTLLDLLSILAA